MADIHDDETRRVALECASRVSGKGDVRQVLNNASLFEAWLNRDETEVALQLSERFEQ